MNVLSALMHNGQLIREAERILQNAVESKNSYVYIENPDGTTIKLQKGFKIHDYEFALFCDKK